MKKLLLCVLLLMSIYQGKAQSDYSDINIIPLPSKIIKSDGIFRISNSPTISIKGFDKIPFTLTEFAGKIISENNRYEIKQNYQSADLFLVQDKNIQSDEAYRLKISSSAIEISAKSEKGIFYGLQTLLQIVQQNNGVKSVALLEIEDSPRFIYRGALLDVGRHLFPVSFIKTYIDLLAQYKFNTFHWHLTEDQGWRIEIKKYPKLTSVGSNRSQTLINHLREKTPIYDSTPYGGFYTQEEVKDIVAYATSKYINVIPEIELPGHSLAALSAYPEFGCGHNPGPYKVAEKWGVFEDVYCAGKEETFKFLENIFDEVLSLFPSKYIHIGGDESPKAKWKTCDFCQKRIKNNKLKDEHELQSYFIQRIEKYLNKKGRRIIGWDEILEGGLAPNATVMSWRGIKGGIAASQQKHDVIMVPSSHLYLDHKESNSIEEPLTIGFGVDRIIPLEKVYSFDPIPAELTEEEKKHIIGLQANLWSEYIRTSEKALYMLLPRMLAVSEIAWTSLENKNWIDFSQQRLPIHLAEFDKNDFVYRVPEPIGAEEKTLKGGEFTFDFKSPVAGAKIYYTINGRIPYQVDNLYTSPFKIIIPKGEERTLKSVTITPSGKRSVTVTTKLINDIL